MLIIVLKLLSSLMYAISTLLDSFLVSRYSKHFGIGTFTAVSGLAGIIPAVIFLAVAGGSVVNFSPFILAALVGCGLLNAFCLIFYLNSLKYGEATLSIVVFRLTPVTAFLIGWLFFREVLAATQVAGMVITIAAVLIFSLKLSAAKITWHGKQMFFMLCSMICDAAYMVILSHLSVEVSYSVICFWYFLMLFVVSLLIVIFSARTRTQLVGAFVKKYPGKRAFLIGSVLNEGFYLGGEIVSNFCLTLLVASLSASLNAFTSVLTFFLGYAIFLKKPKLLPGDYDRVSIVQKIVGLILVIIGAWLIAQ